MSLHVPNEYTTEDVRKMLEKQMTARLEAESEAFNRQLADNLKAQPMQIRAEWVQQTGDRIQREQELLGTMEQKEIHAKKVAATADSPTISLSEYLRRRSQELVPETERINRAKEILALHPEFELFLELQDLIVDGL